MPVLTDQAAPDLFLSGLHPALGDGLLTSVTFLNEVAGRYPGALSLAAGAPYEGGWDLEDVHAALRRFCAHLRDDRGLSEAEVRRTVLQYGRTKGIVHELIARHLSLDEGIEVDPEAVVVTVGFQEALFLSLSALRRDPGDALLAVVPAFVGLTGAARLLGMPVVPVPSGPDGVEPAEVARAAREARRAGLRPRACCLVPDFANPTGSRMSLAQRTGLLEVAAAEDLLILEDNPYGFFPLDGTRLPTLKSLDRDRRVVYLGSLAKTVYPGARIGYVVADQVVAAPGGGRLLLADCLARAKSMVTVNTPPITQAVVGGRLLAHGGSLAAANRREARFYRDALTHLLDGLGRRFGPGSGVRWTRPAGGFFVTVEVPFEVTDTELERSAGEFGVIWSPLHHFYDSAAPLRLLRLSCSSLSPADAEAALDRFASFVGTVAAENGQRPAAGG
ncbi:PLP-dependent aminotransferase family protein [Streptomyces sp. V4-01]|uniref:PLP-dependent aminotransferase family protein n=1 Tax=Actinacidiphila polyblastidii TaxID=3110430 RepID=A0ABU7PIA2_9ACTN|nr:PLP-dependent aminotransferase family protein [Streptomyces sp. V4-01]